MSLYWPYAVADYYATLETLAVVAALIILISSIDDLFIDGWFWAREIWRSLTIKRWYQPLREEQLLEKPEQPIAIMVPAWLEYDVIAPMLENMVQTLDYRAYTIFVGTYRNDSRTIAEVERMRLRYRQLVRVEVPHDGPTCKADCLNWVVQAIFRHEKILGIEFAGVILHDSEDVLHPLELKFFNYLLPRMDLIQIPVNSLEREWYEFVVGVYMDEFAEWHGKDLVVRESMTGMVPSAGVGTCFSRRALLVLASEDNNEPFNTQTLTEDYDIGVRLAEHGMRCIIARFPTQYRVRRTPWFGFGKPRDETITMPLCVREYFPNTFTTSYRQKARWALGICFQGWAQLGWQGTLAERYLMLRDRKGMVTSFVTIFAYLLVLQFLVLEGARLFGFWSTAYPPLIYLEGWIKYLFIANGIVLALRVAQRMYFTGRTFGWEHALLAVPRMVVGNFVNFMAMSRAWKLYLQHVLLGRPLVWDKTMHDFPTGDGLVLDRKRLGALLVSWHVIDEKTVEQVLDKQKAVPLPLGSLLVREGLIDESTIAEAVAFQSSLERLDVEDIGSLLAKNALPLELAVRWRVLPLRGNGEIMLGVSTPIDEAGEKQIEAAIGYMPRQFILRDSQISSGLRLLLAHRGVRGDIHPEATDVPLLGDILVEIGGIKPEVVSEAMQNYVSQRDGRVGEYFLSHGIITRENLDAAIAEQRRRAAESRASLNP
ncbi:glycosyl transferase family protein [Pseudochelatococcus contaminans]|uniref:Adsorption protein B n=1 Tax=Pseudochelatococcus contaminans TaxID=1538103 RepID=A0A7W6EE11_9HYPH|nr:glycosyl transferase family protein [Pseudochelatococcus contaminans]MBB3807978.1 adsorption protein B [Pseudochelatococcus contaminans]